MFDLDRYLRSDATALASAVRDGDVEPRELLELACAQLDRLNPQINAVHRPMLDEAGARVREPLEGPLMGVPFLIKDSIQDYAGIPTTSGSQGLRNAIPQTHSAFVRRLLDAGAVIFGKTNCSELALKGVTEPRAFGTTCNPWDLTRSAGGSSGGAAAAVAAGIVPMAGANDGGGSIRIPAAYCGLFGLRPSRGRVSVGPAHGEIWEGASSDLVISRSVRDSALALDLLSGFVTGDPFHVAQSDVPFVEQLSVEPKRLRIAYCTTSPLGTPMDPAAFAAVADAVDLLASLGHELVEDHPEIDGSAVARCYIEMYFGQVSATLAEAQSRGARNTDFELTTRLLGAIGDGVSAGRYVQSRRQWNEFARALGEFHERYDLYLTPTVASPAVLHGATDLPRAQEIVLSMLLQTGLVRILARLGWLDRVVDQLARDSLTFVPFTQLANLTGTPAMTVPLYWTDEDLPLGVQFNGPWGSEACLLQLGAQLETARPWSKRLLGLARRFIR